MSTAPAIQSNGVLENLVLAGDLSKMTDQQKVVYYKQFCDSLGVNPLTQPFRIMKFQGKEIMYATKDATDQLRKRDGISITDATTERIEDVLFVTVKGKNKDGRTDVEVGAVYVGGLKGEPLANAHMKALTKSKRRLTLSIVGLGMPDESEIETIDVNAVTVDFPEAAKRTVSEGAFGSAVERVKAGEIDLINKMRTEFRLTDQQLATLVKLEDQNIIKHDA